MAGEIGPYGARLGQEVARRRGRRSWDQRMLAERVTAEGRPLSASILGKIESAARRVDADDLVALAAVLRCRVGELLGLEEVDLAEAKDQDPGAEAWGPIETAVRDDIEALGDLVDMAPTLAKLAVTLAHQIDQCGGETAGAIPSLSRELRAAVSDLRGLTDDDGAGDDDLGDLSAPG